MRSRKRDNIFLSIVSVIATLLFLEAALRTYDLVRGYGLFNTKGNLLTKPIRKPIPFRMFGFDPYVMVGSSTLISDRWGRQFPLKKSAGTFRIVCFGGSTTENKVGDHHYPALLQEELRRRAKTDNIEVINVGNSAYATPHSIILLALDVISWGVDLVVLSENINDLLVMYFPDFRLDYWNKYAHEFFTQPDYAMRYSWSNIVFQHSRLYWFLSHRLKRITLETNPKSTGIRRQSYNEIHLRQAESVFERNLKTFINIADSGGFSIMLGTQPLEPSEEYFLRHMAHKPYNDVVVYPPHNEFLKHHAAYNRVLREVSKEMDVDLVDNERIFGGNPVYFKDFVHYTEMGLRKLSENYATAIVGKYLQVAEQYAGAYADNPRR
jgi:GDSL-like Lipase/Acylhydrolase family